MARRRLASPDTEFFASLKVGDVCAATGESRHESQLVHVVRLVAPSHAGDVRYWSARSFCGAFRNSRWYWSVEPHDLGDRKCGRCFKRLAGATIRGWGDGVVRERPLPFGWHEMAAASHPWDVPFGGDPDTVRNGAGETRGAVREERRRWQRGCRIVRLCELPDGDGWEVHYQAVGEEPTQYNTHWSHRGSLAQCLKGARDLMAAGGMP